MHKKRLEELEKETARKAAEAETHFKNLEEEGKRQSAEAETRHKSELKDLEDKAEKHAAEQRRTGEGTQR